MTTTTPVASASTSVCTTPVTKKRKLSAPSSPADSVPADSARSAGTEGPGPAAGLVLPPEAYMKRVEGFRTTTALLKERNTVCGEFTKTFTCDLVGLLGRSVRKMNSAEHVREVKTVTDAVDRAKSYQPLLLIENFFEFLAQPFAEKFRARDFDYFLDHEVFARESARVLDAHFAREGVGADGAADSGEREKEELRTVVNKVFGVMIDVIVYLKASHAIAWAQIQDQLAKMFDLSVKYAYLRAQIAADV